MPLNADRVGHRYPPYRYEVGWEPVREYAAVTGLTDGRYADDAPAGDAAGLPAPPGFVACIAGARAWRRVLDDPQLGAHGRVMHGGQELSFSTPVLVGDVLVCTPRIADLRSLRGMELLTLEVDCSRQDGTHVVTSSSRLVFVPEPADG